MQFGKLITPRVQLVFKRKLITLFVSIGIKELGFPNMNPFHVESVSIISPDMAMKMIDVSVYGLPYQQRIRL